MNKTIYMSHKQSERTQKIIISFAVILMMSVLLITNKKTAHALDTKLKSYTSGWTHQGS